MSEEARKHGRVALTIDDREGRPARNLAAHVVELSQMASRLDSMSRSKAEPDISV